MIYVILILLFKLIRRTGYIANLFKGFDWSWEEIQD